MYFSDSLICISLIPETNSFISLEVLFSPPLLLISLHIALHHILLPCIPPFNQDLQILRAIIIHPRREFLQHINTQTDAPLLCCVSASACVSVSYIPFYWRRRNYIFLGFDLIIVERSVLKCNSLCCRFPLPDPPDLQPNEDKLGSPDKSK